MKLKKKLCLVNDGPNSVFIRDPKSNVFIKCVKNDLCQLLKNYLLYSNDQNKNS